MAKTEGWIKAHRSWIDNPVIWKDSDRIAIWLYLNLKATHEPIEAFFKGKKIILQTGELITGRKAIAQSTKVEESKVYRTLKAFEVAQLIEQRTSNQNSLISLLCWDIEQNNEQQNEPILNNDRTKNEHKQEERIKKKEVINKPQKHKYGAYKNVLLTDEQLEKLKAEYPSRWEALIEMFSEGLELKGYKYKNHYLAIKKWANGSTNKQPVDKAPNQREGYIDFI